MNQTETIRPFLSVVIPTYNRKDSLRTTLDGLSRQDYPSEKYEVLVVSDGSTDGTDAFLASYAAHAPYSLRAITQTNAGPARARNRGIQEASGEIIVFLDDDVEPLPDFLTTHAVHHRDSDHIVVIGPMSPDPQRRWAEPCWIGWEHAMLEKQYASWRTGVWKGAGPNHFYSGNASVRRAHLLAVGGFDETFKRQEDVELAYRMARECGVRFVFDAAAGGLHRPSRSFSSWLKVPYAYGQLDVVRARRGDVSWDIVRHGYHGRNRATRLLASLILACPLTAEPLRALLLAAARACYRLRLSRISFGALSVIYNLRYLEGARAEIGSARDMRFLLHQQAMPTSLRTQ